MPFFQNQDFDTHEQISFFYDQPTGLKVIIAIHNTNRGPALGGCRFWPYASEDEALKDALRLSRGMTYKAALANLQLGGGKAVVIGDSTTEKTSERLHAIGRFIERLNGHYITAEDVGTSPQDMSQIYEITRHVVGRETNQGGSGDPSTFTALGVFEAIRASMTYKFGHCDFSHIRVGIEGLGHVGMDLAQRLREAGAHLIVTDIHESTIHQAVQKFGAQVVTPEEIFSTEVDIFSPCALGGILNDQTIPQLKCKIVAGSANNQLEEARHAIDLEKQDILYAPDYVINAGGLINVSYEGPNYNTTIVTEHVKKIYHTLFEIFKRSEAQNITTSEASDKLARERFEKRL